MHSLKTLLADSKTITVLTGAGVSTDSGVPDFKAADAAWPYEEPRQSLISAPYFAQEPENFWKIYREVFGIKFTAEPNRTHYWLAELESHAKVTIITQNVDRLHQAAGSSNVIEVHGNAHEAICIKCNQIVLIETLVDTPLPWCSSCERALKPNVSLFFEGVNNMNEARDSILESDLFLVIGSSLKVGPVNELPYTAMYATTQPTVWLNRE